MAVGPILCLLLRFSIKIFKFGAIFRHVFCRFFGHFPKFNCVFMFQVYKTQLERFSDGWTNRIGDFERVNGSLQDEMSQLRQENDELNQKVSLTQIEDSLLIFSTVERMISAFQC